MEDLWPKDIKSESKIKLPVAILREQGALLGEKTKNIVTGEVRESARQLQERRVFDFTFYITSTALEYAYRLFSISYKITLYPVVFTIADDDILKELGLESRHTYIEANNEEEFKDYLKRIFNSAKSKRVISAILAHGEQGEI